MELLTSNSFIYSQNESDKETGGIIGESTCKR